MVLFVEKIQDFLSDFIKSLVGIVYVFFFSKIRYQVQSTSIKSGDFHILGNGPSLNFSLEQRVFKQSDNIMSVNDFVKSEWFFKLKPNLHILADPQFGKEEWNDKDLEDRISLFFDILNNKVNWEIDLFVANHIYKVVNSKIKNTKIKIVPINSIPIEGFSFLENLVFDNELGTPKIQNVLALSIYIGGRLLIKYSKSKAIFLYGADHSWFKEFELNNNFELCLRDRHFYDESTPELKPLINPKTNKVYLMHEQMISLAKAFKSYWVLNRYYSEKGICIRNLTKETYIDAFKDCH